MLAMVIIVVVFKNAMQLSNAYGFAMVTVMCMTTVLIAMQIHYIKHLPLIVSILFFWLLWFLLWWAKSLQSSFVHADILTGLFWGTLLKKIPQGAWVPLTIGLVL